MRERRLLTAQALLSLATTKSKPNPASPPLSSIPGHAIQRLRPQKQGLGTLRGWKRWIVDTTRWADPDTLAATAVITDRTVQLVYTLVKQMGSSTIDMMRLAREAELRVDNVNLFQG